MATSAAIHTHGWYTGTLANARGNIKTLCAMRGSSGPTKTSVGKWSAARVMSQTPITAAAGQTLRMSDGAAMQTAAKNAIPSFFVIAPNARSVTATASVVAWPRR